MLLGARHFAATRIRTIVSWVLIGSLVGAGCGSSSPQSSLSSAATAGTDSLRPATSTGSIIETTDEDPVTQVTSGPAPTAATSGETTVTEPADGNYMRLGNDVIPLLNIRCNTQLFAAGIAQIGEYQEVFADADASSGWETVHLEVILDAKDRSNPLYTPTGDLMFETRRVEISVRRPSIDPRYSDLYVIHLGSNQDVLPPITTPLISFNDQSPAWSIFHPVLTGGPATIEFPQLPWSLRVDCTGAPSAF